jgi:hypothetical protein
MIAGDGRQRSIEQKPVDCTAHLPARQSIEIFLIAIALQVSQFDVAAAAKKSPGRTGLKESGGLQR